MPKMSDGSTHGPIPGRQEEQMGGGGGDEARAGEFTCAGVNEKTWNCARARKQSQVDSGEKGQQPQSRRPSGDPVSISPWASLPSLLSPCRLRFLSTIYYRENGGCSGEEGLWPSASR
ncbi:hypothetical protein PVAP13_7KG096018 [Panicum virgatum]|uniref:Uncharacterized protein n=1 Tax=Panicum virgatum TaxID=38727 RepID=A0A8T0Q6Y8_PANVG|nr:hypothetical protein PVAP13_7KG096018 [Panicum virgatum]